jgi:hypothetical protein
MTMTYNKAKKAITATILMVLVATMTVSTPSALAQVTSMEITDEFLASVLPSKLTDKERVDYRNIAINHAEVKVLTKGKPFKFTSEAFIGNIYEKDSVWYPEIHIRVDSKSKIQDVAVVIDPYSKAVTKVQVVDIDPADTNGVWNAYSTQRLTGTSANPTGMKVNMLAPNFLWDGTVRSKGNVLMLNALMSGSNWNYACDSSKVPNTYWAQLGFHWQLSGKINWSDTAGNCLPQFPTLGYASGKTYEFRIVGATTGWTYTAIRTDTGATWTTTGPAVNSGQFVTATNTDQTSVFFENKYDASAGPWHGQFITSPQASSAQYKTTGSYTNWPNTVRVDKSCTNNTFTYPYDSSKEVMSGDLKSGGSASWSMSRMYTYYPNC